MKKQLILPFALLILSCSHPQTAKHHEETWQVTPPFPLLDQTLVDNVPPDSDRIAKVEPVVGHIDKNSIYRKIGLQDGDIIKEWNGKKMLKRGDWDLINESLETSKEFTIVIEREGKEKVLHYVSK